MGHSLGMHVGVPPLVNGAKELETIESFVRSHAIPPEFAHQVMVHAILARYTRVVTDTSEEVVSHSLIRLFDTELDNLNFQCITSTRSTPCSDRTTICCTALMFLK